MYFCETATVHDRPCFFCCPNSSDELCHYLACPICWYSARVAFIIQEHSIIFLPRVCVSEASLLKLEALAFRHTLYHTCVNDVCCVKEDGLPRAASIVQSRASGNCNYCLRLVGGRCD